MTAEEESLYRRYRAGETVVANVRKGVHPGLIAAVGGDAVYIGRPARGRRGSKWANPFRLKDPKDRRERARMIEKYRRYLAGTDLDPRELRGKVLLCWCRPELACHGDVLAELANAD